MYKKLAPILLILTCCKSINEPVEDTEYYKWVCSMAGMNYIPNTRSCINPVDSSYINLSPRYK